MYSTLLLSFSKSLAKELWLLSCAYPIKSGLVRACIRVLGTLHYFLAGLTVVCYQHGCIIISLLHIGDYILHSLWVNVEPTHCRLIHEKQWTLNTIRHHQALSCEICKFYAEYLQVLQWEHCFSMEFSGTNLLSMMLHVQIRMQNTCNPGHKSWCSGWRLWNPLLCGVPSNLYLKTSVNWVPEFSSSQLDIPRI